jgi:hypothetical protein
MPPSRALLHSLRCTHGLRLYTASGRLFGATARRSSPYPTQLRANSDRSVGDLFEQRDIAQNHSMAAKRKGCQCERMPTYCVPPLPCCSVHMKP